MSFRHTRLAKNDTPISAWACLRCWMAGLLIPVLAVLLGAGCGATSGSNSSSFASVVIEKRTSDEIVAATMKVFEAEGYKGARTSSYEILFEREASRGTTIAREGIVDTHYGASSSHRVRVQLVTLGTTTFRLQCKAFVVSGGSDPFFQNEVALAHFRAGPYRKMLKQVAEDLK